MTRIVSYYINQEWHVYDATLYNAPGMKTYRQRILTGLILSVIAAMLGFLCGYFSHEDLTPEEVKLLERAKFLVADEDTEVIGRFINQIDQERIKETLSSLKTQFYSSKNQSGFKISKFTHQLWLRHGLDRVEIRTYNILTSHLANNNASNKVSIVDSAKKELWQASPLSQITASKSGLLGIPPYWHISASGTAWGDLVYVNYGRPEDFADLQNRNAMDFTGKIVIAKLGKILPERKVYWAAAAGAVGVILYHDPADEVPTTLQEAPYKASLIESSEWTWAGREVWGHPVAAPRLPVQYVTFADARQLLSKLSGPKAPTNWIGGYNIGPGFQKGIYKTGKVQVSVQVDSQSENAFHVTGMIKGQIEPDRYVLFGGPQPSYTDDETSLLLGKAVMMEVTRVLGSLVKNGWRPRRTLVFCDWDIKDNGGTGLVQWIRENQQILDKRAVAFLSVQALKADNSEFMVMSNPLLKGAILHVAKQVPNPNNKADFLFDTWKEKFNIDTNTDSSNDQLFFPPQFGSTLSSLIQQAGIPVADISYGTKVSSIYGSNILDGAEYNTIKERKQPDTNFTGSQVIARLWGAAAIHLADSTVLPLKLDDYASYLSQVVNTTMFKCENEWNNSLNDVEFDDIKVAVDQFANVTSIFQKQLQEVDKYNILTVHQYNDQLTYIDRAFVDLQRHILFTKSLNYKQVSDSHIFPGFIDWMSNTSNNRSENMDKIEELKKYLLKVANIIGAASKTLEIEV